METRDTTPSLRASLDSHDPFLSGGHGIIKTAGATRHAERMKKIPVWVLDDKKVKEYIQRAYPGKGDGRNGRKAAERVVKILYLYYRVGSTLDAVAEQFNMTRGAVRTVLRNANKTMSKPVKPRGRPKKKDIENVVHIQASNEVNSQEGDNGSKKDTGSHLQSAT